MSNSSKASCGGSSRNPCNIKNVEQIKHNAKKRHTYKPLWVRNNGRLGLVFPAKYDQSWWTKAKGDDIRRVAVY